MIYGNEKEQNLVKEWLESEKRGALLIVGPEGVGKFCFVKEILKD
jgi:DNA polymerase III delta prime subunit